VFTIGSQGPAELRRLLIWASKKRRGGIIIIDESECCLLSRTKTKDKAESDSGSDYSRDCLNVLLSMTGSLGNIMLILTTTDPSELDEAFLDRMDEIIHLPLPSAPERNTLLRNQFVRQFRKLDDKDQSLANRLLSKLCRTPTKARFDFCFDVDGCLSDLASLTKNFSGRELEKLIQGVAHKTYASDNGVLDVTLWRRETRALVAAVAAKHRLK